MRTELFDYHLPEALIAQRPPPERDGGRLLVVGRDRSVHRMVKDLPDLVAPGSLVVVNESRVLRARLVGTRQPGGGRVEIFLLDRLERGEGSVESWKALGRANRPLRPGTVARFGNLTAHVVDRAEGGTFVVELRGKPDVASAVAEVGHVPLPPYVRRPDEASDRERYQTVFARHDGSVAAPTAGLHLTREMLERLRARDVTIGAVTLHVGLGTFRPVESDDLDRHEMHSERYVVSEELASEVARARTRGAPVVAVGTTVVRALQSARDPDCPGHVLPGPGETSLLIQPGYEFDVVDALLTNFHMPKSTLLALVAAFAGRTRVLSAYAEAVSQHYRFLSYGDAMWLPERLT